MSTNCMFPPELDDKQLLTYLDDPEANRETALHLEQCSYCREKAEALDLLQKRMTSRLYRVTCPSPIELGEFHLRMLPASQMLIIRQHLRECPHCAREISRLEEFMIEPDPQPGLIKSARVLIARLIKTPGMDQDSEDFLGAPAFAGLRGEGEDEPFIYQAGNVRVVIEVQEDLEEMGLKTLLGLVTGLETNEFTIQVVHGDQVIATTSVDEIGNFIIPHLSPGHYKLILSGSNMEIHVQSLPVR